VHRSLRGDVSEGQAQLVFVYDIGGNAFINNFVEECRGKWIDCRVRACSLCGSGNFAHFPDCLVAVQGKAGK
jgi:hypothetical protein